MMLRRSLLKFRFVTFRAIHVNTRFLSTINKEVKIHSVLGKDNVVKSAIFQDIPDNVSVYDHVTSNFSNMKDKIAFIDGISGEKFSYGNLESESRKFGSFISKNDFNMHDTLVIYSPNDVKYAAIVLGTLAIGGSVSTANPQYTKLELVNQLLDSKSKMIVTTSALLETAKSAAKETGIKQIINIDEGCDNVHDGVFTWSDIISDDGNAFENRSTQINAKETCALLPYSSGTTGKPKGVVLTHHNLVANGLQLDSFSETLPRNISLGLLPFFHIYGLSIILLSGLRNGETIVTLPKFEPQSFLQAIQDHKIDYLYLVPPLVLFLIKAPEVANYDISSIRHVTSGAAPFGTDLWKSFTDKFSSQIKVIQGYGLSEVSPLATLTPGDDVTVGSVGKIVPNSEMKVVDSVNGKNLGPNSVGEIAIKGPHVMKGYLNNPEATDECLTKDGWFLSGDLGYYDDGHNFYIVDRSKELIKYKGMQVAPAELEDFLMSHEKIRDAAVVGIPDKEAGELPKAFVVTDGNITEEEVVKYVETSLAPFKRLRGGVEFVDSIPKSTSGKILRRILREKHI
eukprot:gene17433-19177_t